MVTKGQIIALSKKYKINETVIFREYLQVLLLSKFYSFPGSQKIYFQDTGLRNYVTNNFSPLEKRADSGSLFENAVFNLLSKKEKGTDRLRFWRTVLKNEVDFVRLGVDNLPLPYECKLNILGKPKIPGGLLSFVRSYQPKEAFVVNLNRFAKISFGKTKIYFLPGWGV